MVHRTPEIKARLEEIIDNFFDSSGHFTGRLPDDYFRFKELTDERSDIQPGDDAASFVNQLAAATAHKQRSSKIRNRIKESNQVAGVKARLYPYQVEGIAFLAGTGRALLADDMGLGKTLQSISAAVWLQNNEGVQKTLIICPASLKQQWAREIEKFTDLESQIIQGPPPQRGVQYRRECSSETCP